MSSYNATVLPISGTNQIHFILKEEPVLKSTVVTNNPWQLVDVLVHRIQYLEQAIKVLNKDRIAKVDLLESSGQSYSKLIEVHGRLNKLYNELKTDSKLNVAGLENKYKEEISELVQKNNCLKAKVDALKKLDEFFTKVDQEIEEQLSSVKQELCFKEMDSTIQELDGFLKDQAIANLNQKISELTQHLFNNNEEFEKRLLEKSLYLDAMDKKLTISENDALFFRRLSYVSIFIAIVTAGFFISNKN
jgi:ribosomal protein S15P/S13E